MKILETPRLLLRHLEMEDLDKLFELYGDPEITRYIPDAPKNYEEAREELEWHRQGHPKHPALGLWATVLKETDKFIGRCGLLPWIFDGKTEVEVAYLISQAHWRKGLGTEAALAIRDYGFGTLNLPKLICLLDEDNTGSIKVSKTMGMNFERTAEDEYGSFLIYSMENPLSSSNLKDE